MKNFIITVVLFIISLVVGDYIIAGLSDAIEKYTLKKRPEAFNIKIPYIINCVDADVLIWGASTASHNYITQEIEDSIGMSTYNCGLDGTFIYFQTAILDLLLDRYTPRVIVWEISPNCLSSTISEKFEFSNISWLYPYYVRNEKVKYCIDLENQYNWLKLKSKTLCRNTSFQNFVHCYLTQNNYYPTGYAPIYYEGAPFPQKEPSAEANDIVLTKEKCLDDILHRLDDKHVKIVFAFCPIYRDSRVFKGKSYKRLLQLADKYNVEIINSYDLNPIANDSTYFKDCDHMYDQGARKYMKHFIPKLKKIVSL